MNVRTLMAVAIAALLSGCGATHLRYNMYCLDEFINGPRRIVQPEALVLPMVDRFAEQREIQRLKDELLRNELGSFCRPEFCIELEISPRFNFNSKSNQWILDFIAEGGVVLRAFRGQLKNRPVEFLELIFDLYGPVPSTTCLQGVVAEVKCFPLMELQPTLEQCWLAVSLFERLCQRAEWGSYIVSHHRMFVGEALKRYLVALAREDDPRRIKLLARIIYSLCALFVIDGLQRGDDTRIGDIPEGESDEYRRELDAAINESSWLLEQIIVRLHDECEIDDMSQLGNKLILDPQPSR